MTVVDRVIFFFKSNIIAYTLKALNYSLHLLYVQIYTVKDRF